MYQIDNRFKGDSGGMSDAFPVDENDKMGECEHNTRPRVGVMMVVGAIYARSYCSQDWWRTNVIKSILIDEPNYVKFETLSGSVYEWKCDQSDIEDSKHATDNLANAIDKE
jgi:hypothetical protein